MKCSEVDQASVHIIKQYADDAIIYNHDTATQRAILTNLSI